MSKPSFVYCFSKKLAANEEQYAINLLLLNESIGYLKGLYDYRIITDSDTINDLKHLSTNIEFIDTSKFIFLEDLKVKCISLLKENEIIVDPDLFIFQKLEYNSDFDLIFEHKDSPKKPWYTDYLEKLKGTLLYDKIILTGKLPFVPNIGFFKITNDKLLSLFVEEYYRYREDIINKLSGNLNQYNLLLGQYLLGIILYEGNFSYLNLRSTNSAEVYTHMAGPDKYRKYKVNKPVI